MRYSFAWIVILLGAMTANAQNGAIQGHSYLGGTAAVTQGMNSSNTLQGIVPSATITVYNTGTQNKATIYSDGQGTPLANPFTSNALGSVDPGGWIFWGAVNQGYDVVMSGGICPNCYVTPITRTDIFPSSQFISPGGTCIGTTGPCIVSNPTGSQTVAQPAGTTLQANVLSNHYWANLYGTGSNGIETVYGNAADCIPQLQGSPWGCSIEVAPYYTNADEPPGWTWGNGYGNNIQGTSLPGGASVYDYRNGELGMWFHDPINPITVSATGLQTRTELDLTQGTRNMLGYPSGLIAPSGLDIAVEQYTGGWDMGATAGNNSPNYQNYTFGQNIQMDDWTSGISFGQQVIMNHHAQGDGYLSWERILADGGILAGNSQGIGIGLKQAEEDPTVFQGTVSSATATGPSTVQVNCTQGCGTQGQNRLLLDVTGKQAGNFFTSEVGPQTTGNASNSAVMPPTVTDTAQNWPVSTIVQLCYPAGGSCTAGAQPTGNIPSTGMSVSVTAGSTTATTATLTGNNSLSAGQSVTLYGFPQSEGLNGIAGTVSATGLSATGFQVTGTFPVLASTGAGFTTEAPNSFSPATSIVLNVVPPYTGTGGNTNGLPSGFCSSSTLQSSNSGAACYMPASGVGCLTDGTEYETVRYTYNTNQTITIANMLFPHLNGVVFATGGMCGHAVEDVANAAPGGTGASGTIAPTYFVAGSLNATTLLYVPQRTNEPYGEPTLGLSNPGNQNAGYGAQLYLSTGMGSISVNGSTVTFGMYNPAGVDFGSALPQYNGLTANISTANSTYNGNFVLTWQHDNVFTYTLPAAPSGTTPTSGTVSYNNAQYALYPAARVNDVYDPNTHAVDGYFALMPNATTFTNGDTVREAHYQQMMVNGEEDTVTRYEPEQFLGTQSNISYTGVPQGAMSGFDISNMAASTLYLGHGGTHPVPHYGYEMDGVWHDTFNVAAPESSLIRVQGWKADIGQSKANSNFNLFQMPALSGVQPGANSLDVMNYDPNCHSASQLSSGLYSGCWSFSNNSVVDNTESPGYSYGAVRAGYLNADQGINTASVSTNNLSTTPLANPPVYANTVGTAGSTTYNYWVVGHGTEGGTTAASAFQVTNGNATLSSANYNLICIPQTPGFSSYDFYKTNTSTLLGSASPGNGGSMTPAQPANYACIADTGQATTAQTAPTTNTTGGAVIQGPLVAQSLATFNGGILAPNGSGVSSSGDLTGTTVNATSGYQLNGVAGGLTPSATAAGQVPVSTGSGTSYAAQQVEPQGFGYTFYAQGPLTISAQAGGSGYTGTGSCTLNGGVLVSGAADTCTVTLTSGALSFALSGSGVYTVAPTLSFSGFTGGSGASATVTLNYSSGTYLARNNQTGSVDFSNADAGVVIRSAINNIASTCGHLYFTAGVYNINSLVAETTSGFSNYYAIGFPGNAGAQQYCQWIVEGDSTPDLRDEVGTPPVQTSGVVLYVTPAALSSVSGTPMVDDLWVRPDPANSGFSGALYVRNVDVRFPNNQRGNETGIDATQASNVDYFNVMADTDVIGSSLALPVAGSLGMYGVTSTNSVHEENNITRTVAVGYYTGIDVESEHTVLINSGAVNGVNCIDYGVRGATINHASSWVNLICGEEEYALNLGPNLAQGTLLDISGFDMEDLTSGTFLPIKHVTETNAGYTYGHITYTRDLQGVQTPISGGLFDGGGGTGFTVKSAVGTLSQSTAVTANGAGGVTANLFVDNEPATTGGTFPADFLVPNLPAGGFSELRFGQSANAGQMFNWGFLNVGTANPCNQGFFGVYASNYPLTIDYNNNVGIGVGLGNCAQDNLQVAGTLSAGSARQFQVSGSGAVTTNSPTGTSVGPPAMQAIGGRNFEGWNNATPTAAWNLGYYLPNTATGSGVNPTFYFYNGSAWAEGWHLDISTGGMVFDNAVTAPSVNGVAINENDVASSATPAFNATSTVQHITLTANVTSSTIPSGVAGYCTTLQITENATGGFTFVWPTNVVGAMTINTSASKRNSQHFCWSVADALYEADSPGVTGQ